MPFLRTWNGLTTHPFALLNKKSLEYEVLISNTFLHSRFPKDPTTYPVDRQFLLGPALLITPVLTQVSIPSQILYGTAVQFNAGSSKDRRI